MRLIVDMNLSPEWVGALERLGVAAVHWSALGAGTAPDREIVAVARRDGSVTLTRDLDFGAIVTRDGLASPSVIQLRVDRVDLPVDARLVSDTCSRHAAALADGVLVTIGDDRIRFRPLNAPLRNKQH
jgi:predicted nuclease of predicted toxin-antitoxin system